MTRFALVIAIALAAGCDDGTPTGSTCPTSNAPTYGSFGQVFFTKYCASCHSSSAANRNGAPDDFNFDTEAEIKQHAADIDTEAASGPKATNTAMPELDADVPQGPSMDDRVLLGQFLACEEQSN
ncbi:MAG TPA: hypothetical protein VGG28_28845 [Kofleriaceae bacterium]|jgi:uncharacterized membrane protein